VILESSGFQSEFHTPVKVEKVDGIERIDLIAAIDQVAGAVERLKD
jgi:hypothetical protein